MNRQPYRGRFAPSPTGPLHFGSLIAAVGSYLQARSQQGEWLIRIEDLDPPREIAGASDAILRTLEAYGFEWDGEVSYQSRRHDRYAATIDTLRRDGLAYPCTCSRKEVAQRIEAVGGTPGVYPGSCRSRHGVVRERHSIRLRTSDRLIEFDDPLQGRQKQNIEQEVGDFVLLRADGFYAYQLAVVVDDAEQGITEVVRGSDLLDNSPRQIYLQQRLQLSTPAYLHLPVVVNKQGQKLSKQTFAPPLDDANPQPALYRALSHLGQQPPVELLHAPLDELWHWATANWNLNRVPAKMALPISDSANSDSLS